MVVISVTLRAALLTFKDMAFVVSNPCFRGGRGKQDKTKKVRTS